MADCIMSALALLNSVSVMLNQNIQIISGSRKIIYKSRGNMANEELKEKLWQTNRRREIEHNKNILEEKGKELEELEKRTAFLKQSIKNIEKDIEEIGGKNV